ncbi:MAG: hypothetical protein COS71_02800 [Candidatus Moranbacteria bacterium CG06_land_8_20_14_3_00_40_12]|uniref:Uncharacterized protein n=1 Tax=Candidatus Nealsonbacteria bacterium CG23_combo_of_CG06-09_8_20_14_all_37_18 TaxID=1974720 RepID=A0A2G9YZ12_9BACT|nr:MAG: hypothetical protein COX35_00545 [Candidatus Nealsonbacteria bacterium CG23_combo_of_CG06-09_8_20_14_all_37_18]PIU80578.1 MAG: hypothetical protein COS71_02800 [Candidatus Moranbacteria bacterium CG06_land_8_20_14_3_00_40_12]
MKKPERNLEDLYLLNKESQRKKIPFLLNDLKRAARRNQLASFDLPLARYVLRTKKNSILLPTGKRKRTRVFFPEQSHRYAAISPKRSYKRLDSLYFSQNKPFSDYSFSLGEKDYFLKELQERYSDFSRYTRDWIGGSLQGPSLARAWNVSIIGAVIFGMVTMTFIYRYLGESVSAKINEEKTKIAVQTESKKGEVLGAEDYATDGAEVEFVTKLLKDYGQNEKEDVLEKEIRKMVKGYPIEEMVPEIVKQDRIIAAFLVSIAKKESNWGKRVPVLNGQDCYNYWGYRGIRKRMGTGGHTCFDSHKDAVDTVAKRLETLIEEYGKDNPEKMVIWKCGSDCNATGGQAAANKWISDVNLYFKKLNKKS